MEGQVYSESAARLPESLSTLWAAPLQEEVPSEVEGRPSSSLPNAYFSPFSQPPSSPIAFPANINDINTNTSSHQILDNNTSRQGAASSSSFLLEYASHTTPPLGEKNHNVQGLSAFLALAAADDVQGLNCLLEYYLLDINGQGEWEEQQHVPTREPVRRTALMVAASHSATKAIMFLVRRGADVNVRSHDDGFTPLHCAVAGGGRSPGEASWLLTQLGADSSVRDNFGRLPMDLYSSLNENVIYPHLSHKFHRERMVMLPDGCPENNNPAPPRREAVSALGCKNTNKCGSTTTNCTYSNTSTLSCGYDLVNGKDENDSLLGHPEYSNDEFRMYRFKIDKCTREDPHNWRGCPFVHPGETAQRRDPRKHNYSGVACPDFRRGSCIRGDSCRFAHGVFECWLHPSRYKTEMCKDLSLCNRPVCFFAHTASELRPMTGEGSHSPSRMGSPLQLSSEATGGPASPVSILDLNRFEAQGGGERRSTYDTNYDDDKYQCLPCYDNGTPPPSPPPLLPPVFATSAPFAPKTMNESPGFLGAHRSAPGTGLMHVPDSNINPLYDAIVVESPRGGRGGGIGQERERYSPDRRSLPLSCTSPRSSWEERKPNFRSSPRSLASAFDDIMPRLCTSSIGN